MSIHSVSHVLHAKLLSPATLLKRFISLCETNMCVVKYTDSIDSKSGLGFKSLRILHWSNLLYESYLIDILTHRNSAFVLFSPQCLSVCIYSAFAEERQCICVHFMYWNTAMYSIMWKPWTLSPCLSCLSLSACGRFPSVPASDHCVSERDLQLRSTRPEGFIHVFWQSKLIRFS